MNVTNSLEPQVDSAEPSCRRRAPGNPLQRGIESFLADSIVDYQTLNDGSVKVPKRYTLYPPLLLLPVNFETQNPTWQQLYFRLSTGHREELFDSVARTFAEAGQDVTRIAINARIAVLDSFEDQPGTENVLRSPSQLIPTYGDFGPATLQNPAATLPTRHDFDVAFWVSTKQSQNVIQVWAPRWTMFSRGNITEKSRILGTSANTFPGLEPSELGMLLEQVDVVDLYVGIGYFAFSYLARGVKRVWGWDLNPWSIEGLRKGCQANGWRCVVVVVAADGNLQDMSVHKLATLISQSEGGSESGPIRCVAFQGDNTWAASVMAQLKAALDAKTTQQTRLHARHVNLGLLPSSRQSWGIAVKLVDCVSGGWLHVHENVDISYIETKSRDIVEQMDNLLGSHKAGGWRAECQHVEPVKTYAPGVMHCVFDIRVRRADD
jgi:tRNA wybutosine-synthesizing protein 2